MAKQRIDCHTHLIPPFWGLRCSWWTQARDDRASPGAGEVGLGS